MSADFQSMLIRTGMLSKCVKTSHIATSSRLAPDNYKRNVWSHEPVKSANCEKMGIVAHKSFASNFLTLRQPSVSSKSGYRESTEVSCEPAALIFSSVRAQCILTNSSCISLQWKADWKKNLFPESRSNVDTIGGICREISLSLIAVSRKRRSSTKTSPSPTFSFFHPGISAINQGWCITAGSGAANTQSQSMTLWFSLVNKM